MTAAEKIAMQESIDARNAAAERAEKRRRDEKRERAMNAKPDPAAARYFARLRGQAMGGVVTEDDEP